MTNFREIKKVVELFYIVNENRFSYVQIGESEYIIYRSNSRYYAFELSNSFLYGSVPTKLIHWLPRIFREQYSFLRWLDRNEEFTLLRNLNLLDYRIALLEEENCAREEV